MREESPGDVLDEVARLKRLTRARVHGAVAPLTVFGVLTLASMFLYVEPFGGVYAGEGDGVSIAGTVSGYAGLAGIERSRGLSIGFWLVGGTLGYLACAWWYRRRAARIGLTLRWQPWALVGAALMGLVLIALFAQEKGVLGEPNSYDIYGDRVLSPLLAIALGLLVLARMERSRGVAVIAVIYGTLSVMMNAYGLGQIPAWIMPPQGGSHDLFVRPGPNVALLAAVLLIGALILQLRVRARRRAVAPATA